MPATPRLDHRFRRLWAASTISNLGDGVAITAMPLLAARGTPDAGIPASSCR